MQAGTGPPVLLVHSSVAGARQWRRLMGDLEDRFTLIAVNLIGYGRTPAWAEPSPQTLEDQGAIVASVAPEGSGGLSIIGHSFGGTVAMKAAALLGARVERLILIEPNPFYLLKQHGRDEAFAQSMEVRNRVKTKGGAGEWTAAAEWFADYWSGPGTWAAMPDERKGAFAEALKPNFHEWDAVMSETTSLAEWAKLLPAKTHIVSARETKQPLREIVELMQENCPGWKYEHFSEGGHMAPLTHPHIVNPLIASLLEGSG